MAISGIIDDRRIALDVEGQLMRDDRVNSFDIDFEVDQGYITLTGKVPSYLARQAAAEDAGSVEGVVDVDNRLVVIYPPGSPEDEIMKLDIEGLIKINSDMRDSKIGVSVKDRWVTLEGTVDAPQKKTLAERLAEEPVEALGITNKIAIVTTKRPADEMIAKRIEDSLSDNVGANIDLVDVTVEDGEVVLSGTVGSEDMSNSIYNIALQTRGVKSVKNNLLVSF